MTTGSNLAQFGSYELDAADEEQEALEKERSGNFLKLKVGKNILRLLPPPIGRKSPFVIVYEHYINMPGEAQAIRAVCPRLMAKEDCPICARAEKFKNTGNQKDRDRAFELFPKRRVYAACIDRGEPEKGPQIVSFGKKIHEALVALRRDEDTGGDFTHPIQGFDIIIERTGTGKNDTSYAVRPSRKQSALGNMDWLNEQPDLGRFAVPDSEESIREKLAGGSSESGGSKDKDKDESRGRGRTRSAADDIEED